MKERLWQLSLLSLMFNMISDIDECEAETTKCSSNAVCHNTKGSYNCACKPGYEGDGNNCTGNFFREFVFFADHRKHCGFYFSMVFFKAIFCQSRQYYLKIQKA